MALGLIGRKCGMTRVYVEDGAMVPVSVVEVLPHRVTQIKTKERDGYTAVQVTTGSTKTARLTKPEIGHYAKAGIEAGRGLWEFRVAQEELDAFGIGAQFGLEIFQPGEAIDVQGVTIGKGFAGTVKRHHFNTQDATHGNSRSHRVPGSIGQRQTPGRVWKGKKMCGHLGDATATVQRLKVVKVLPERNLILVSGSIPGPSSADVIIRPTAKKRRSAV